MEYYKAFSSISVYPHHIKQNVCTTRAKYRQGKKETAVKVYTINQESLYIIISNVSAVGCMEELRAMCDSYGIVNDFHPLDDYPCEEFTEAYLVKYDSFFSARAAKKLLDGKSLLGNILHVFYAPEFETSAETSMKLQNRRMYIARKTKNADLDSKNSSEIVKTEKRVPATSNIDKTANQPMTYVWAGKEYSVYPNCASSSTSVSEPEEKKLKTTTSFLPRQVKTSSVELPREQISHIDHLNNICTPYPDSSKLNDSHSNTMSHVRSKINKVSVPNVRVSFKRKRRI